MSPGYNCGELMSPETPVQPLKILFVCLANLCRSPLAVALTRHLHAPAIEAASAGVAPASGRMFPEALQVIKRVTGQDMSGHVPRFVLEARPQDFDYIIAMDSGIFLRLSEMPQIPQDRLYGWEIADPCGFGIDAYEKTAVEIESCLEQFLLNREMDRGRPGRPAR
jgi:protein-tyrosine phosphatase